LSPIVRGEGIPNSSFALPRAIGTKGERVGMLSRTAIPLFGGDAGERAGVGAGSVVVPTMKRRNVPGDVAR